MPDFEPSSGDDFESYTLMMDLMVYDGQGAYFSLFQNDLENTEDGVIFIENRNDGTGRLEILRGAHGTITYGQWHRIALTVEKNRRRHRDAEQIYRRHSRRHPGGGYGAPEDRRRGRLLPARRRQWRKRLRTPQQRRVFRPRVQRQRDRRYGRGAGQRSAGDGE
ncbi:hypothetical protein ACFSKM_06415 [Ancylobacter dichloromethanicus]